jgi:hypothetical protein
LSISDVIPAALHAAGIVELLVTDQHPALERVIGEVGVKNPLLYIIRIS